MNNAPFKVGQKVVALKNMRRLRNGVIYTVAECFQCPKCNEWHVGLLEFPLIAGRYNCVQNGCIQTIKIDTAQYGGAAAKHFAPIDEPKERIRYVAVSETLREQAVEVAAIETN